MINEYDFCRYSEANLEQDHNEKGYFLWPQQSPVTPDVMRMIQEMMDFLFVPKEH